MILDERDVLADVIRDWISSRPGQDPSHRDPVFSEWLTALTAKLGPGTPKLQKVSGLSAPLNPLTKKETQILRLLAEGYSNAAMAEKLFVSDSTVRTHLRNINSKLDTSSRTQAVAAARYLGILS